MPAGDVEGEKNGFNLKKIKPYPGLGYESDHPNTKGQLDSFHTCSSLTAMRVSRLNL